MKKIKEIIEFKIFERIRKNNISYMSLLLIVA